LTFILVVIETKNEGLKSLLLQPRLVTKDNQIIGDLRSGKFVQNDDWSRQRVQFQHCGASLENNSITVTNVEAHKRIEITWLSRGNDGPIQFT